MKHMAIIVLTLMVWMSTLIAQTPATVADTGDRGEVDELVKLEELRNQAVLHGDIATLDRMTSNDYTFITLRGEMRTKSEILDGFKSGSFHYESREISDLRVHVYGNTAVVTSRSVQKGTENGKDYSGDYRFTRVYVKQKGSW